MTSNSSRDAFLLKWRNLLRKRQNAPRTSWEGQQACADLKRTGYLNRVRIEELEGLGHNSAVYALPKLCSALLNYKANLGQVRMLCENQEIHADWLLQEEKKFRRKANSSGRTRPDLSEGLSKIAKKIEKLRLDSKSQIEYRWSYPMEGWVLPTREHGKITQERQLDSWFQIRIGSILRSYLPKGPFPYKGDDDSTEKLAWGPSLRTIARLVILFLLCSELAEEKEGYLRLVHNNRKITVGGVLQQLRKSGFEKYVGVITVRKPKRG